MMQTLILFDIDGTLLASKGVGKVAMARAMAGVVGDGAAMRRVDMAGKCDWAIWREALAAVGWTQGEVDARLPELSRRYVAELAAVLSDASQPPPEVLPGVRALLRRLAARDEVVLGLLTGNTEAGAWLKLRAVGLDGFFGVGAFGDESPDRGALPALAVGRAEARTGQQFEGRRVVIVGDTVHDVRCGAALGARAIGVATGGTDAATLHAAGANAVFASLEDGAAVEQALLG